MNRPLIGKFSRTVLVVAVGALGPISIAHAIEFLGNNIPDAGGSTPMLDASNSQRYDILGSTIWGPKSGAEGPVRTETLSDSTAPQRQKIEFLGNVIWVPKP